MALSLFHPLIQAWFEETYGSPTDVQEKAWSEIANDGHLLITAPTGSGKTLAAFLWAINSLVTGRWSTGTPRILYVSPLKALNNDIHENLKKPLCELKERFLKENMDFPDIRVGVRSGDTPSSKRRKMIKNPPEILITTPESLNILLTSKSGKGLLTGIKTVILDEIHNVAGGKRGVHLVTAVERLVYLSGEFQRIALSATVKPLTLIAEFVGGFRMEIKGETPSYSPRPVNVVRSSGGKKAELSIVLPDEVLTRGETDILWDTLAESFFRIIQRNRSTLFFVNSRKLSETLVLAVNRHAGFRVAYAHHGSLSREIRHEVEKKLKEGSLKAIIATHSLELGIDIGSMDEVVLVQAPGTIASALQRVGRSGHRVGETCHGTFFPSHSGDFLESAVALKAMLEGDIENVTPVSCPLDILGQIIISITGDETWKTEDIYNLIRCSFSYRNLEKNAFLSVLSMLAGRNGEAYVRELKPRIHLDRVKGTVHAAKGAVLDLYMSGGSIPDRGYYKLRHHKTRALIGELDEEFVWEARPGQAFSLGTTDWRIRSITASEVLVEENRKIGDSAPFWKGEMFFRGYHFSEKIGEFLETANRELESPEFMEKLMTRFHMDRASAQRLISWLSLQKKHSRGDLPHRRHILVEYISSGPGGSPGKHVVIHTFWGGRVNKPFALALERAWDEKLGPAPEIHASNDGISILTESDVDAGTILGLVTSENLMGHLLKGLERSGFFSARFRECAARSLLITRTNLNQRMPLWMSRLKSKKLLDSVSGLKGFPVVTETFRTCLRDEFELGALKKLLGELSDGEISWSESHVNFAGPFAGNLTFGQVNRYMYQQDQPLSEKKSLISGYLESLVTENPDLRPAIPLETVRDFESRRMRCLPGYYPSSPEELKDFLRERVLVPETEWDDLIHLMAEEADLSLIGDISSCSLMLCLPGKKKGPVVSMERAVQVLSCLFPEGLVITPRSLDKHTVIPVSNLPVVENSEKASAGDLFSQWLSFYGPIGIPEMEKKLGFKMDHLIPYMEDLIQSGKIISGELVEEIEKKGGGLSADYYCDSYNYEIMLRMRRAGGRRSVESVGLEKLPLLMATLQGVCPLSSEEGGDYCLEDHLDILTGIEAPAAAWESEILPARIRGYDPRLLDEAIEDGLLCIGSSGKKIGIWHPEDLLFREAAEKDEAPLFKDPHGRYDFMSLMLSTGLGSDSVYEMIWENFFSGRISCDCFKGVRQGILGGFKTTAPAAGDREIPVARSRRKSNMRRGKKHGFSGWKDKKVLGGNWFMVNYPESPGDILDLEDEGRERVRILMGRYGVLFRELLMGEAEGFRWGDLFRSMRLMELSGEIVSGMFFQGVSGVQFASGKTIELLARMDGDKRIYWINCADPASVSGLPFDEFKERVPARSPRNHVVYRGTEPVLVSEGYGRKIWFLVSKQDPDTGRFLEVFHHMLKRSFMPVPRIVIEEINGEDPVKSDFLSLFERDFDLSPEFRRVILRRRVF